MTTNAGAIAVVVQADTASFESSMTKVGAAAERELKRAETASAKAKVENDKFVASIQRQIDTFGLTGPALLAYEANLRGVSAQAQPLIDKLKAMKEAQVALNAQASANSGLSSVGRAMGEAANGADQAAHGTAGLTRELLVLGHEASQGNFKRFGGSLLVLAEYSTKAQAAISAMAGPVGAVVAVLGLLAFAAYEGSKQADELRKSLILTGNFAGVTAGQLDVLSRAVSAMTGSGIGKAASALQALVATGEVGPKVLAQMAETTVKLESLTGKSADEIAKDFAKLQEAPTKWAEEANKAYNFLSAAQYAHIKRLEEEGHSEQAVIEVLERLNDHIGSKVPESLTVLGRALHATGLAWDKFWHDAVHEGAPETTQDKIDKLDQQISRMKLIRDDHTLLVTNVGGTGSKANIADMEEQRRMLQGLARNEEDLALATAARAKADKDGITASDFLVDLQKKTKGIDQYKKDLTELDAYEKKRAKGRIADGLAPVQPGDAAEHATDVAYYQHKDRSVGDKSAEKQINEYDNLAATIKAYNTTTAEEASRMGKLTEGQKFLIQIQEQLEKSGKKLTETQKLSITADAAKAAGLRDVADQELRNQAATMKRIEADTANEEKQQAIVESVIQSGNAQADSILRNSQLIGKSADEVTKLKALQGYDDMIGKALLGADNDTIKRITQVSDVIRGNLVSALDDAKAKQEAFNASFGNGFKVASDAYIKQAQDNAAYAEKFFNDAVGGMTNALVNFVQTGKFSWKSMVDSFISDLARMEIQKGAAALLGGGSKVGGGLLASLAGMFGGSPEADSGSVNLFAGASNAGGIGYVPYDGYPTVLHEGERVMTRIENQRSTSDGGQTIHVGQGQVINVGQGVSRSEVQQAVTQGNIQTLKQVQRLSSTGKLKA